MQTHNALQQYTVQRKSTRAIVNSGVFYVYGKLYEIIVVNNKKQFPKKQYTDQQNKQATK